MWPYKSKQGQVHDGKVCFYAGRHYAVKVTATGEEPDLKKPLRPAHDEVNTFVYDKSAPYHNDVHGTRIADIEVQ